jgi:hypothetical protein
MSFAVDPYDIVLQVLSLSQNLAASGAGTVFLRNCQIKVSPVRVFLERRIIRHCQVRFELFRIVLNCFELF